MFQFLLKLFQSHWINVILLFCSKHALLIYMQEYVNEYWMFWVSVFANICPAEVFVSTNVMDAQEYLMPMAKIKLMAKYISPRDSD